MIKRRQEKQEDEEAYIVNSESYTPVTGNDKPNVLRPKQYKLVRRSSPGLGVHLAVKRLSQNLSSHKKLRLLRLNSSKMQVKVHATPPQEPDWYIIVYVKELQ